METFALSDIQAKAILDMRLQGLPDWNVIKSGEYNELLKLIEYYQVCWLTKICGWR